MDNTQTAVAIFDKLADRYQERFMDTSLYHVTLDLFCSHIPKQGAELLELACGPGNVTQYVLHRRPDFHVLGTDLAPNMLRLAQQNNPSAAFQLLDCRDMRTLRRKFDAILCAFCLPYLSKEEAVQLMADAAEMLSPDGVLYLSTMEDEYARSGWQTASSGDRMYQYYHEAAYLLEALSGNGFRVLDLKRIRYDAADGTPVTDLVIVAEKK